LEAEDYFLISFALSITFFASQTILSIASTVPENIPHLQGIFIVTLPIAFAIGFFAAGVLKWLSHRIRRIIVAKARKG